MVSTAPNAQSFTQDNTEKEKGMKIIVVGCGKVGATLTEQLSIEGHDVSVIDVNSAVVENVVNNVDVLGVVGNGASHAIQQSAGIDDADLLIAATDSDELNLLCCLIAKKAAGCSTIARVRNPVYNTEIGFIRGELGLSLIVNPEAAAAVEAARILRFPSAIKIENFVRGRVEMLKFVIPEGSVLNDCPLYDISKRTKTDVLVCTVERGADVIIPDGSFKLRSGDMISIVASPTNTRIFVEKIGLKSKRVNDTIIVGGGTIAYYLAKQLISSGIRVKIIEKDRARCEELCDLLPKAIIIHGDASDQNFLLEEGVADCESFVTLTGMDEENLFLSLFASHCSKAKVITKVNRIAFDDIIHDLNLGTIIHPKYITADNIMSYVRAMQNSIGSNVETLYNVIENKVEALEFMIHADAPVLDIPLAELKIKKNVIIACIYRKGEIIIPNGSTEIKIGDRVIVVTSELGFRDIKDIVNTRQ